MNRATLIADGARAARFDAREGWLPERSTRAIDVVRAARSQGGCEAAFWRGYLEALLALGFAR